MSDAATALVTAIDELRRAREALPADLGADLDAVVSRAESLLEALRLRDPA